MEALAKTIFLDIDGVLFRHFNSGLGDQIKKTPEVLPYALERLDDWNAAGYTIVLCTGRKESCRGATEAQLEAAGVYYDVLIMGLPRGERVVINDTKPDGTGTARGINILRNSGLKDVAI